MAESIMEKVRRFAGADPAAPDAVLEMCYRAAVEWYKGAGVQEDPQNELWLFWVCNLAAWMYDNRGNADAGAQIPIYIVTSVHQLRTLRPENNAAGTDGSQEGAGTDEGADTETDGGGDA